MNQISLSRAWVLPFTVGFTLIIGAAVVGIVWVVGSAERTAIQGRASEELSRAHRVAAMVLERGAIASTAIDDSLAGEMARAGGTQVVLIDTNTTGDPRILGSTLGAGADVLAVARRQRVEWGSVGIVDEATVEGARYFVDTVLRTGPGGVPLGLIALWPAHPGWYHGGLIRLTVGGAGLLALALAFGLVKAVGGRLGDALNEIVVVARRAAKGDAAVGVRIAARGPLRDLGTAVQALIDRARAQPPIPDAELERVSSTQLTMPAMALEAERIDGANLRVGQVFADRYEVLEVLGRSDVRTAYRVRDRELDELILLKTLAADLFTGDPTAVERFKADLRVARRLSHRNILRTYDFGEWKGVYYVTMELVDAIPLRQLLEARGRLNVASTLALTTQASRALTVAHRDGVLHRDIRPESLLLAGDGQLKVADFGLASPAHRTRAQAQTSGSGKALAYQAPEVLQARPVDRRSDIYSLGAVAFECLAGRPPFSSGSAKEQLQHQLAESPPDLASLNPEVPQALSDVLARTLARQPEDRPQDGDELRGLLTEIAAPAA